MDHARTNIGKRWIGSMAGIVACGVLQTMLAGCVPAESTRYKGTMSRSVKPDRTASAEVAGAFGLRNGGSSSVSLASADE